MDQKTYEMLEELFLSEGYKYLIANLVDLESTLVSTAPDSAISNDYWQYLRGKIHTLRSVIGYEDYVKMSWKAQEEDVLDTLMRNVDDADII